MSYDIDSERYSVHPNDDGTWTVIDEYYDELLDNPEATFIAASAADAYCRMLNDNENEYQDMRAQERAFELYWGGDDRHAMDRPATRDELIGDWEGN